MERDRAVQMCAAAVEERERLKRAFESLGEKYSLKKGQKSPETRVDRRKARKAERRTSLSEDSDSPALADDAEGPAESPAPEYVHEGWCWKTSSTDGKVDTEQVGGGQNPPPAAAAANGSCGPKVSSPEDWWLLSILRQQTGRTRGKTSRKRRKN